MNILRCSSCKMFQSHIVKKAKKWQCKMCNFKQAFSQVYFQGSGKDCRVFVQQLNLTNANELEKSNDYSNQSALNVTENKFQKYLDVPNDTFEPATSSSKLEKFRYVMVVDNDNESYSQSQSERAYASNESVDLNNGDESFDYDEKTEFKNVSGEMIESVSYSADDSKNNEFHENNTTEMKCTKNIFDANEDVDLTIDF
ncbi:MRN complex-interacting protein isoform X1 [Ceratina calcarata]|uniref:MRN complex-interacting protein isoform X1 n=1 Tax=Ceratina calcarata TaxID=156304 RepID=A0AAJ7RXP4_9HYME|nr:MRN complex-interacting protein isoform X1 [Ceratina calcarata]